MFDDFGGVVDVVHMDHKLTFIWRSTCTRSSSTSSPKLQPSSDSDSISSDGNSVVADLTTGAQAQALLPTCWDELRK